MSRRQKLRVGVAGLGTGKRHVRGFRKHPEVEVVAAADPDPERREFARRELGVPALFETCHEMLDRMKLDVCSIATPNATHRALVLHAFEQGCHVLCEKPLGISASQGCELVEAAGRAQRRLMINMPYRFLDQVDVLRSVIASGGLGEKLRLRSSWLRNARPGAAWYRDRSMSGGGVLLDLGIHRLDLALHLLGFPQACWIEAGCEFAESASGEEEEERVETGAHVSIGLETGATLDVSATWLNQGLEAEQIILEISGTRGTLWQSNLSGSFDQFAAGYVVESARTIRLPDEFAHRQTAMQHFASAILEDHPHSCTGGEAISLAELIDAAYVADRENRRIALGSLYF